jgi:hypothetical protein
MARYHGQMHGLLLLLEASMIFVKFSLVSDGMCGFEGLMLVVVSVRRHSAGWGATSDGKTISS